MEINSTSAWEAARHAATAPRFDSARKLENAKPETTELRKAFDSFVGESFYGQLLSSMRKSVGKPAYFHGGQAEEIFRGQLDQTLAAKMTEHNAGDLTGSMFELFQLGRG